MEHNVYPLMANECWIGDIHVYKKNDKILYALFERKIIGGHAEVKMRLCRVEDAKIDQKGIIAEMAFDLCKAVPGEALNATGNDMELEKLIEDLKSFH